MPKHDDDKLKCSFCGKTQDQVKKLIAGPEVYICDECVELCNEILDEEFFESKDKESSAEGENIEKSEKPIPKPHEIKAYLDQLQTISSEYDDSVSQSDSTITKEKLQEEKQLYLKRRYWASIDID